MARVTENWFYENKDIHHSELANFLDDVIIAEFNCDVQVIILFPVTVIMLFRQNFSDSHNSQSYSHAYPGVSPGEVSHEKPSQ